MATPEQLPSASSSNPSITSGLAHNTVLNPEPETVTRSNVVNIGSRKSVLALIQTDMVHKALLVAHPSHKYEIHTMSTIGDKDQATPLHNIGAKALWTHELEIDLLEGRLDLIVNSLKDMPTQLPAKCVIGCITMRADPRDAVVMKMRSQYKTLAELPPGSVIGTSSVRRSAQILRNYPHLKFKDVRGNVGTRLSKLDADGGEYACLILAAAGLERMDLGYRVTQYLDSKTPGGGMLYAVGQGALCVEIREGDQKMKGLLEKLGDRDVTLACLAERSLMRALEGGCSVPIGVETEWIEKGKLIMRSIVLSLDGKDSIHMEMLGEVLDESDADDFGQTVARGLVEKGATKILEAINLNRNNVKDSGGA